MTLRNALGDLALDQSITALTTAVEALHQQIQRQPKSQTLPYARDPQDRMRVVTDTGSTVAVTGTVAVSGGTVSMNYGNNGAYTPWYSTGAPMTMDARDNQRELTAQTFLVTRNRWVIS